MAKQTNPVLADYDLPDPLTMLDGTPVQSAEQWHTQRRPELRELFQEYVYGPMPSCPIDMEWHQRHANENYLDGKATLREFDVSCQLKVNRGARFRLLVITPQASAAPLPAILGLNRMGNHTLVDDPGVTLPDGWVPATGAAAEDNRAKDADRNSRARQWPIQTILERGYALAGFYPGELFPDRADSTFLPAEERASDGTTVKALAAWAWAAQRALDVLRELPRIDSDSVGVFGHSRRGKTALLAAAYDERFALAIPHQAGCGGTAPSRTRNPEAETLTAINDRFPHWFCGRFKTFNDRPPELPVDQHELVALLAPRPVLLTAADDNQWADPTGQFHMLMAADPVYRLLDVSGLADDTMPPIGRLSAGRLGYFQRKGKHATTEEDWQAFFAFTDKHLKH